MTPGPGAPGPGRRLGPDWYCGRCGGLAELKRPSIAPGWSFGRCIAQPVPCLGRQLISTDLGAVRRAIRDRRADDALRRHARHRPKGRAVPGCPVCYPPPDHLAHLAPGAWDRACAACLAIPDPLQAQANRG